MDELARFREQWKEEVRARTAGDTSEPLNQPSSSSSSQPSSSSRQPLPRSPVDIYAEAVEKEQRGELDAALDLYRRAFKLDPNVDRVYHVQSTTTALASLTIAPIQPKPVQLPQINVPATSLHSIRTLVAAFPPTSELLFAPEIEEEPVPIAHVPNEILLHVLKHLDIPSVERFAVICRRARLLTLDPDLWRDFVVHTYIPPQIPVDTPLWDVVERYGGDMRRLYIELPRVRTDGVYIAICQYFRPGQSENAWVNVDHLVTYHRYLRFLPDGRVLSLLDQNLPPKEAVKLLTPDLKLKGFFIGTWTLTTEDDTKPAHVTLDALTDPMGAFAHSFRMELTLSSKPLGRWNRLTIDSYKSLDSTGTPSDLPIRNERPFWFSKVKSWT